MNYIANIIVLTNSTSSGVRNQKRINKTGIDWTKLNICQRTLLTNTNSCIWLLSFTDQYLENEITA
jgi:hypothetical protein